MMRMFFLGFVAVSFMGPLYGFDLSPFGAKNMGMGGTGVAHASGGVAVYYNPALLASKHSQDEILGNLAYLYREYGTGDTKDPAEQSGRDVETYNGNTGTFMAALGVQYEQFGLGYYASVNDSDYWKQDDPTYRVTHDNIQFDEWVGGYAFAWSGAYGVLSLGGSVKAMQVGICHQSCEKNGYFKSDVHLGVDVGILYAPEERGDLRLGAVVKNVNRPALRVENEPEAIELDPLVRVGAFYALSDAVALAIDWDVTEVQTSIEGYDSRDVGVGLEYQTGLGFSVTAGVSKNISEPSEGVVGSFGRIGEAFDVSVQFSDDYVGMLLGLRFGL